MRSARHRRHLAGRQPGSRRRHQLYDTQKNAYLDLASGRVDGILADAFVQWEWLKSDAGKNFEFKGEPVFDDDKIAIAVRKGNDELRERLNKALAEIIADGTQADQRQVLPVQHLLIQPGQARSPAFWPTGLRCSSMIPDLHGFGPALLAGTWMTINWPSPPWRWGWCSALLGALAKTSPHGALRWIGGTYSTIVRGVPELLWVLLIYFGTISVPRQRRSCSASPAWPWPVCRRHHRPRPVLRRLCHRGLPRCTAQPFPRAIVKPAWHWAASEAPYLPAADPAADVAPWPCRASATCS